MGPFATGNSSAPTIDDLVALNDEIIALVRTGVPLERGLGLLVDDLPGQLGRIVGQLSERMSGGQTLAEALADGGPVPAVYGAVVQAGVRSGRLAVALEGLTTTLRRLADLRIGTGLALLYPLFVALLAWTLFCFFVVVLAPQLVVLDVMGRSMPRWVAGIRASVLVWGPLVPALIAVAFAAWWSLSARAVGSEGWPWAWLRAWIPGTRRLRRYGCLATFAEVLALLVEREVPLPEALQLAAAASGDHRIDCSARRTAEAIEQGQDLAGAVRAAPDLPPFLGLSSFAEGRKDSLTRASRQAAETYRGRAEELSDWLQLLLPVLLTIGIGASVTAGYALLLFWPWVHALKDLALP